MWAIFPCAFIIILHLVRTIYLFNQASWKLALFGIFFQWLTPGHFLRAGVIYSPLWFMTIMSPFSSVQFSHSVVSDSLRPHESQHARPPCPSPTPRVHSDSRPSCQWCHPAISFSVVPFSSCPQSLPASESFPMNQLFAWGGQSTGVSAVASFPPKKSQGWSPSEWTGEPFSIWFKVYILIWTS